MIFVYYSYGPSDIDGVGLKEFQSAEEAAEFIQNTIAKPEYDAWTPELSDFTVIEGKKLDVQVKEVVAKVKIG